MVEKKIDELSVADVEQLLKEKQTKIARLQKRRAKLVAEIEKIDTEIDELSGKSSGSRFKNKFTNLEAACHVLARHKKGLTLDELTNAILKTGHRSTSKNFRNTIYQAIHNSKKIKKDAKTKRYMLSR